jgi:methylated-DNA-[protein]-cysteine S-methyltransferase
MDERRRWTIYESPIGSLTLIGGPAGLSDLNFPGRVPLPPASERGELPEVAEQLDAYFAGELTAFDLKLDMHGTELQKAIWRELLNVPYGETRTYGQQAERIDPALFNTDVEPWRRARVAGGANGRNPVSIIVPCHRIIGANGSLTGYGGGLERKQALLDLERSVIGRDQPAGPADDEQMALI